MIVPRREFNPELLERALLTRGFRTLRVSTLREAFFRANSESFSVIVCEDSADGSIQAELAQGLDPLAFGVTTPIVILGPSREPASRAVLTSLLDQYFPSETDPELIADFITETDALRATKAKRGRIGPVSVPYLIHHASQIRMTGALVIENAEEKCIVYLEGGHVVFASSNRDENRFGEFLVQQRIISREQFLHAARILQSGGKRFGRILVEEGFLKPQVLSTLIQSQVKHIIFNVFDWTEGEFYILFHETSGQDEPVARFEVAQLILEGVGYKYTETTLGKEFQPFDAKVTLSMSLPEIQRRMHLGRHELDFLILVGAGRPIEELLHLISFSRLDSLRLLFSFRILGVLSFEKGAAPPARKPASTVERTRVMDELFASKSTVAPAAEPALPHHVEPKRSPAWRVGYVAGAASIAIALSAISIFVTLFEPRLSRDVESHEKGVTREPVASPAVEPKALPVVPTTVPQVAAAEQWIILARLERNRGNLEAALRNFRKAQEGRPEDVGILIATGDVLFELDRLADAATAYQHASNLEPKNPAPHLALGTLFQLQGNDSKARESYHRYLAVVPGTSASRPRILEVRRILQTLEAR